MRMVISHGCKVSLGLVFFVMAALSTAKATAGAEGSSEGREVSPHFIGLNLSYFNDLDMIWENYGIPEKIKDMDARILRYPGGEETSRWHWNRPGVNGYVDIWNPEHGGQTWQTTWVPQEKWESNEEFMDIDEYFAHCEAIGAEPLLGVNMTVGEVNDRREDGIQMAVDMIRHVKEKGYPLRYVYLDNEPWHRHSSNYYFFPGNDYAELTVLYVDAIREVMPDLKFIANPFEHNAAQNPNNVRRYFRIAGDHVDVISVHYYWEWGRGTWDIWTTQLPMLNTNQWRDPEAAGSYIQELANLRNTIHDMGFNHVELAVLEWNISRAPEGAVITPHQTALMQSEMLMQFLEADVVMTTIWPTLWAVQPPEGWFREVTVPSQRHDRSIFERVPPYDTTPSHSMFRFFREVSGGSLVSSEFLPGGQYVQHFVLRNGDSMVLVLNKSEETFSLDANDYLPGAGSLQVEQLGLEGDVEVSSESPGGQLGLPGFTLTRITPTP